MKTKIFDFELPEKFIAQKPKRPRDQSRLMVVDRKSEIFHHNYFYNLNEYLSDNDILVFNNSRVFPGKITGKFRTGGKFEILLLREREKDLWECLASPARKFRENRIINVNKDLNIEVASYLGRGLRLIKFNYKGKFKDLLERVGEIPLPPYIKEEITEKDMYQTIYSKEEGSSAAPTAGLHFTHNLFEEIKKKGIDTVFLTLHIGIDTFRPINEKNIEAHKMHKEKYFIDKTSAKKINKAISENKRIVAVGTTAVRALESAYKDGKVEPGEKMTSLYITPGYKFKVVDALITNFHLPKSTLIVLVSAFAGIDLIKKAYQEAKNRDYRFFSFGDTMFIE